MYKRQASCGARSKKTGEELSLLEVPSRSGVVDVVVAMKEEDVGTLLLPILVLLVALPKIGDGDLSTAS